MNLEQNPSYDIITKLPSEVCRHGNAPISAVYEEIANT